MKNSDRMTAPSGKGASVPKGWHASVVLRRCVGCPDSWRIMVRESLNIGANFFYLTAKGKTSPLKFTTEQAANDALTATGAQP